MGWSVHDYPSPPPEEPPVECPVCFEETTLIYTGKNGEVIGCDNCVTTWDAWEWRNENV